MSKTNRIKLAICGPSSAPKLLASLQFAYGLCRDWSRVIVIGSSSHDSWYQHLGAYHTLPVAKDATPQRYCELLNMAAGCGKQVVVFSSLSDEWSGVLSHMESSYYQDILRFHRTLFQMIRHTPVHVISLLDTRTTFLQKGEDGRRKLCSEQVIQQPDVAAHFSSVLSLNKQGLATVEKDETGVLPTQEPFRVSFDNAAILSKWCSSIAPETSTGLQRRINACATLGELYQLLFEVELEDMDALSAFSRRRQELEAVDREQSREPNMEIIAGGLL